MKTWIAFAAAFALIFSMARAQTVEEPVLEPNRGGEIGAQYQSWLSPHQEGDEEANVPLLAPDVFRSTAPSVPRAERPSRGHGMVRFTRDLSKAYVDIAIEGVDPQSIVMFHLHCGRPGQLGPIIVDFGIDHDLMDEFADGRFSAVVTNEDLVAAANSSHGIAGFLTAGCPIVPANPLDRIKTIAGMAQVARQGELYFNLHTDAQTFFGDIRGQLEPM